MISRVWPAVTLSPTATKSGLPGSGQMAVPTMGDFTAPDAWRDRSPQPPRHAGDDAAAAASDRRGGHRHAWPGNPDTPLAVGQLDLAEIGLVKDLRQLADELGIHLELCHGETLRGECQRASRRDSACNARR